MKDKLKTYVFILFDMVLINLSILLAYCLRFDGQLGGELSGRLEGVAEVAAAATLIKIAVFAVFRLYNSLWRYASVYELFSIAAASFLGNFVMLVYAQVMRTNTPRSIFIITFFVDVILIGGVRFAYRILRRIVRGQVISVRNGKRVLVVGAGDAGANIIRELKLQPELNSIPVAIVDDNRFKIGKKINGVPVLGNRWDISRIVKERNVDEIIIAIPSAGRKDINEIYTECAKTNCKVKILPSVSQLINETVTIKKVRDVSIDDLLGREQVSLDIESISSYLKNQVILVTGAGGSIGSEICRQIVGFKPKQLIILDNYENTTYDLQNELLYKFPDLNLAVAIANIREKQRLETIFKTYNPDVVFHAAAHKHVPLMELNPAEAIKNNVFGTLNTVECADKYKVKRFVLISTDKAVNPTNVMGATKRIAEMIIQANSRHSSTVFAAVRFGNVLGSNGSVIPLFKKQIEQGGPVTVTHPEVTRFFMTIPEAVRLVIQAGAMAIGGEIFVLDMGQPVKIYDLARNLIKLSGFKPDEDIKIVFTGLRPGEKLYEELLLAQEGLEATKHNKIYIAKPIFTDLALLKREIEVLSDIILNRADDVTDYLPNIVPEYKKACRPHDLAEDRPALSIHR